MTTKANPRALGSVYLLQHVAREDTDDESVKALGVYSSESKARAAIKRLVKLPGFRRYPKSFYIDRYTLNQDKWIEGFVTRRWTPKSAGGTARTKRAR